VEVEDVAGVCLAAGRPAEQQRHLAVGPGVLAEVVVDAQRVLDEALAGDLDAVLHDLLAHRHAGVGARYWSGAGSSAPATTTIVCSIAPFASSTATVFATVESFWPIAT
jgi:hypothetical protein